MLWILFLWLEYQVLKGFLKVSKRKFQDINRQLFCKNLAAVLSERQWSRRIKPKRLNYLEFIYDEVLGCWMIYFYSLDGDGAVGLMNSIQGYNSKKRYGNMNKSNFHWWKCDAGQNILKVSVLVGLTGSLVLLKLCAHTRMSLIQLGRADTLWFTLILDLDQKLCEMHQSTPLTRQGRFILWC